MEYNLQVKFFMLEEVTQLIEHKELIFKPF